VSRFKSSRLFVSLAAYTKGVRQLSRNRMSHIPDQWSAGSTYEQFMGRWSRKLARDFVDWLQAADGVHWLELGCGTGALTSAICDFAAPAVVVACDPAQPFIEYAQRRITDPSVSFVVAGAHDFPLHPPGYDVVTSLLAFNFFPDPEAALKRMSLAGVRRGLISACVWDYAGEMQFLRYFWDAASVVDPKARVLDEAVRFATCKPEVLTRIFHDAGLVDVRCEPLNIETAFSDLDDYWAPLLGGTGPAPSFVASLDEARRAVLRSQLEETLPRDADGVIRLRARAWAIRGTKPPDAA